MSNTVIRQCSNLLTLCRKCSVRAKLPKVCSNFCHSSDVFKVSSRQLTSVEHRQQKQDNSFGQNQSGSQKRERPVVTSTMDEDEMETFRAMADSWWDEYGEFDALHSMNKVRIPFIRDGLVAQRVDPSPDPSQPLQRLKIVDAGCGGGLLAEPLARLGAFVVGVDPVEQSTKIAQLHLEEDPAIMQRVKYITGTIEDLVVSEAETFDAVVASEVVEHVADLVTFVELYSDYFAGTIEDLVVSEAETFDAVVASEVVEHVADLVTFVETCCRLVKPGGSVFFTTINKTQLSKGLAVFAAEKVFRVVPEGTHDWEKFVPPDDLQKILEKNGVDTRKIHGLLYNPVTREWCWMDDTNINYAVHGVKHDINTDLDNQRTETKETQSKAEEE